MSYASHNEPPYEFTNLIAVFQVTDSSRDHASTLETEAWTVVAHIWLAVNVTRQNYPL